MRLAGRLEGGGKKARVWDDGKCKGRKLGLKVPAFPVFISSPDRTIGTGVPSGSLS